MLLLGRLRETDGAVVLGVYVRRTGAAVLGIIFLPNNVHDVPPAGAPPTGRPEGDDERQGGGGHGDGRGRLHAGEEREQKVGREGVYS